MLDLDDPSPTQRRASPFEADPLGREVAAAAAGLPDLLPVEPARRPGWLHAGLLGLAVAVAIGLGAAWYLVPSKADFERATLLPLAFDVSGPGVLDSTALTTVSARIAGRLEAVVANRNDTVRQGTVLARLAANDMAQQLVAAQADAKAAQPVIDELRSQRAAAEATLRRAAAHLARRRTLAGTAVVSRDDLEIAEADDARARAEVDRLDAAIARAGSQTVAATANAEVAAARFDDAVIRAPIDGVVIARDRNPGDMISPGTPIFRLVDPRTIVVAARFDEGVMGMLDAGSAAVVRFNSEPQRAIAGAVLRLHREVDQETREFVVDIALSSLPRNWALGQRASVALRLTGQAATLTIGQRFVARRDGQPGVWVPAAGRAHWQAVSLGLPAGDRVEITAGLSRDAVVLAPGGRYEREPVTLAGGGG